MLVGTWHNGFLDTVHSFGHVCIEADACAEVNGTGYQRLAIQIYLEGDNLSWLWKSLFSKQGFGERPEKV